MKPLTRKQREAVKRLYDRDADGARNYRQFRRRVMPTFYNDDCVIIKWAGMYVGIETDGYTHT